MERQRVISLAAGTGPHDDPIRHIITAAQAGYSAVGIRPAPGLERQGPAIRSALEHTGLLCLDVEVVRITSDSGIESAWPVLDLAAELGARHVVVVSREPDWQRTVDLLGELCAAAAPMGIRPTMEFMPASAVRSLREALRIAEAVGDPAPGIIVDPLHLARSGELPSALSHVNPTWFPYLQICDAPALSPKAEDLDYEALHCRLLPGDGELPLESLLAVVAPTLPLSVEVMSDDELKTRGPLGFAVAGLMMTNTLVARAQDRQVEQ